MVDGAQLDLSKWLLDTPKHLFIRFNAPSWAGLWEGGGEADCGHFGRKCLEMSHGPACLRMGIGMLSHPQPGLPLLLRKEDFCGSVRNNRKNVPFVLLPRQGSEEFST